MFTTNIEISESRFKALKMRMCDLSPIQAASLVLQSWQEMPHFGYSQFLSMKTRPEMLIFSARK